MSPNGGGENYGELFPLNFIPRENGFSISAWVWGFEFLIKTPPHQDSGPHTLISSYMRDRSQVSDGLMKGKITAGPELLSYVYLLLSI